MAKTRKRAAIAFARNFAAGVLENAEIEHQQGTTLTEDEMAIASEELQRIADRLHAAVNVTALEECSREPRRAGKRSKN